MEPHTRDRMARREEVLETVDSSSESDSGKFSNQEEWVLETVTSVNNAFDFYFFSYDVAR